MADLEDVVFLQPGPVKVHPRVLRQLSRPTLHHRTPEFSAALNELTKGLQAVFQTSGDVTVINGSGTAGMEAAIGSVARRGERVVAIDTGKFGARMADIAGLHAECVRVQAPWGQAVDVDAVATVLEESPTSVLAFVHNETSTGAVNPAQQLIRLAKKHDALVVMDAVTSLGSVPVPVDEWGVDVCITGSQKCLAGPAGLALLSVSARAYDRLHRSSYYLDLKKHVDKTRQGTTPYTPSVPLYLAMDEAVRLALEEGLEARFARTRRLAEATRAAAEALGLQLYAAAGCRSDTITSIQNPEGIEEKRIRGRLKDAFNVHVAGGQDDVKGKIFRVGHMANVTAGEIIAFVHALEVCLADAGHTFQRGAGLAAASEALAA